MKADNQNYLDNTLEKECVQQQYKADFGGYRPHFEGRNPNLLPNTKMTYVAVFLLLIPAYILSIGLFVGVLIWATEHNESYTFVCLAVFIATVVFLVFISYIGSFDRSKKEKDYIAGKEKQLAQVKELIKNEVNEAENLLLTAK